MACTVASETSSHRWVRTDAFLPPEHPSDAALLFCAPHRQPQHCAGALHHVAHEVLDRLPQLGILGTEACLSLVYVYVWGTEALPILCWTDVLCSASLNRVAAMILQFCYGSYEFHLIVT